MDNLDPLTRNVDVGQAEEPMAAKPAINAPVESSNVLLSIDSAGSQHTADIKAIRANHEFVLTCF